MGDLIPISRQPARSELLTPQQVAAVFRVDPKTVTRWARRGQLAYVRTPGGHRRYARSDVEAFLNNIQGGAS